MLIHFRFGKLIALRRYFFNKGHAEFFRFLAKVMPKWKRPEKRDIKEELDKLKATMRAMVAARVEKTINDMIPTLVDSIKASTDRDKHGPVPIYNVVPNNQNAPVIESPAANPSSGRDDDGCLLYTSDAADEEDSV